MYYFEPFQRLEMYSNHGAELFKIDICSSAAVFHALWILDVPARKERYLLEHVAT
jgi:hypothetical protein